ncbi:MAG: hypothetical protein ACR2H5_17755 [Ktedonobacteraceae bacterium]
MMQDNPRDLHDLPPCPLSKHYLQYLDLLDPPYYLQQQQLLMEERVYDLRMVERLRAHLSTCSTCTATVRQARWLRSRQRAALSDVLMANEQKVPSTVVTIMTAVQQEARPFLPLPRFRHNAIASTQHHKLSLLHSEPFREKRQRTRSPQLAASPRPRRSYTVMRTIFSITAVVALIFTAVALFNQLTLFRTNTGHFAASPSFSYSTNWDTAVLGHVQHGQMFIDNYDPYNGRHSPLVPSFSVAATTIDGVSHDGHNVLYHYSSSGHTYYATLMSRPQTGYFYSLSDANAGAAIWMSDSQHVLIATQNEGIIEVDSQSGATRPVALLAHVQHLWFYRNGYLYFDYTKNYGPSDLWRVAITTGTPQRVLTSTAGRSYFISPDGTTVFYADTTGVAHTAHPAIYTMKVDPLAPTPQLLLTISAIPIGFAADNTLELMREEHNTFQVVKLQPTQPAIDRVVMANVAPGALALCDRAPTTPAPICDENIALAPYGGGLLVTALNKDGSRQVWADNLATNHNLLLQTLSSSDTTHVQLPGWDRIQVS